MKFVTKILENWKYWMECNFYKADVCVQINERRRLRKFVSNRINGCCAVVAMPKWNLDSWWVKVLSGMQFLKRRSLCPYDTMKSVTTSCLEWDQWMLCSSCNAEVTPRKLMNESTDWNAIVAMQKSVSLWMNKIGYNELSLVVSMDVVQQLQWGRMTTILDEWKYWV